MLPISLTQVLYCQIFSSLVIPLVSGHFYVTEAEATRHRLLFFRKPVWAAVRQRAHAQLNVTLALQPVSPAAVLTALARRDALGVARVRLLPKRAGIRPIMDLSKKLPARWIKQSRKATRAAARRAPAAAAAVAAAAAPAVGMAAAASGPTTSTTTAASTAARPLKGPAAPTGSAVAAVATGTGDPYPFVARGSSSSSAGGGGSALKRSKTVPLPGSGTSRRVAPPPRLSINALLSPIHEVWWHTVAGARATWRR